MVYTWASTIYTVFNNKLLEEALDNWAKINKVKIIKGNPDSEDIVMKPYFAAIIDRTLLSKEMYKFYLDVLGQVNNPEADKRIMEEMGMTQKEISEQGYRDDHLCILVDNIKDKELPRIDLIMQVGFVYHDAIPWIINNLEYRRTKAILT